MYGTGTPPAKHNLKTGSQVPVEIIAEVDRKIDDGLPYAGGFQFSPYVPTAASTAPDIDDCGPLNWNIAGKHELRRRLPVLEAASLHVPRPSGPARYVPLVAGR